MYVKNPFDTAPRVSRHQPFLDYRPAVLPLGSPYFASCAQSLQSEAVDRSRSLTLCRVVGVAFSVSGRTLSQHLRNLRSAPKILRFRVDLISRPHSVHACARPTVSARPLAIERLSLTRCAAGLRCSLGSPPVPKQTQTHTTTTAERLHRQTLHPPWPTTTTPPGLRLPPAASSRGSSRSRPPAQVPATVSTAAAGHRVTWTQAPARP